MKYDELRKEIKTLVQTTSGLTTYFVQASDEATYPYLVFDIQENYSDTINIYQYSLVIDGWDKGTPKAIISAIDKLDKVFKQYKASTDDFNFTIYLGGTREFVEDEDKSIRHLLRNYDLTVYPKTDL